MENIINIRGQGRLGFFGQQFLAYSQLKRQDIVRLGEMRSALGIDAVQEIKLLSRLARSRMIVRLKRGVYLVPPRLPLGGGWNPGAYRILYELMRVSRGGRYQLCGLETFNRYGFTEQIANRVYVYNNRLSGDKMIGGTNFSFIRVADGRLGGTEVLTTPDGAEIIMPTLARTLMDSVYDWPRFGTLPRAYEWIRQSIGKNRRLGGELAEATCRFGNLGTIRRIGFVLDKIGYRGEWKNRMLKKLKGSRSLIPLVPEQPAKGSVNEKWGVIVNE